GRGAEGKRMVAGYGIPVVETKAARDADEAGHVAEELQFPVALKILSPDIAHKSDVGGVALNLDTAARVRSAAAAMLRRCAELQPRPRLAGFNLPPMAGP